MACMRVGGSNGIETWIENKNAKHCRRAHTAETHIVQQFEIWWNFDQVPQRKQRVHHRLTANPD